MDRALDDPLLAVAARFRPGPQASPLPPGLDRIRALCEAEGGFWLETDHHVLCHRPGRGRLVVSFDNLSSDRETSFRKPFGHDLIIAQGWGNLGVIVKRKDWFQCPQLKAAMVAVAEAGLFARYPAVSLYGSSMGAFGAALFAGLAPGAVVLAFAPQSTLRPKLVPFETRYRYGRGLGDWTGDFTDATRSIRTASRAYVLYDPCLTPDRLHAARLTGPNVLHIPLRHFDHKLPPMLLRMGILKELTLLALRGDLDLPTARRMLRKRRDTIPYVLQVLTAAQARGHGRLALRAAESVARRVDNHRLKALRKTLAEASAPQPAGD